MFLVEHPTNKDYSEDLLLVFSNGKEVDIKIKDIEIQTNSVKEFYIINNIKKQSYRCRVNNISGNSESCYVSNEILDAVLRLEVQGVYIR